MGAAGLAGGANGLASGRNGIPLPASGELGAPGAAAVLPVAPEPTLRWSGSVTTSMGALVKPAAGFTADSAGTALTRRASASRAWGGVADAADDDPAAVAPAKAVDAAAPPVAAFVAAARGPALGLAADRWAVATGATCGRAAGPPAANGSPGSLAAISSGSSGHDWAGAS
jgi:hypothetical protein